MKKLYLWGAFAGALLLSVSCSNGKSHEGHEYETEEHAGHTHAEGEPNHEGHDGHDHAHEGHDHAHEVMIMRTKVIITKAIIMKRKVMIPLRKQYRRIRMRLFFLLQRQKRQESWWKPFSLRLSVR